MLANCPIGSPVPIQKNGRRKPAVNQSLMEVDQKQSVFAYSTKYGIIADALKRICTSWT
jgi:hypothetical protein